jgi:2-isopropylmalate synthase
MAAAAAGADRVHGTALGVGERAGNAEMEQLLVNLYLQGRPVRLARLAEYCRTAARGLGVEIPPWQPIAGSDAFRTGTGLHADAIGRALARGDRVLADLLYSSLPAALGIPQQLTISPASGTANVRHWLERHGFDPGDSVLADALLAAAKASTRALAEGECERIVEEALARVAARG